ncbi:hypothetical protein QC823_14180 [Halomonas vilamensis]|uniref:Uncharacterized protein n=1 Tax=Vreelandella vilamensis TaxID=531309 RepID=A0ABU1H7D5_9GAMM|nr:hypothetical protein [Halomonas vilamensis]MDR5900129.1 hypothetical protein [Halomonas vilamensis]
MPSNDQQAHDHPLQRLKGSVHEYKAPFEPVGVDDWEALQQEYLTYDTPGDEEMKRRT